MSLLKSNDDITPPSTLLAHRVVVGTTPAPFNSHPQHPLAHRVVVGEGVDELRVRAEVLQPGLEVGEGLAERLPRAEVVSRCTVRALARTRGCRRKGYSKMKEIDDLVDRVCWKSV